MDRARKRELRSLNDRAWTGEKGLITVSSSLDSNMRKNSSFQKRLRTAISATNLATFLQEIRTLSLHKWLSETVTACYDGLCRLKTPAEIEAGVEIVSALHQRFGPDEFTQPLASHLAQAMAPPDKTKLKTMTAENREKDERDRLMRQRVLIRVVTELWLVGVLRTLEDAAHPHDGTPKPTPAGKPQDSKSRGAPGGAKPSAPEPFPLEVLKDLLGHDREHVNLPLLVAFVKAFSWDILGIKAASADGRKAVEEDGATKLSSGGPDQDDDPPLTPPELQERFKNMLRRYFEDVKSHLERDQRAIFSQSRRNAEAYVKSGEVFEDRQANFDKQVKAQERLAANAQVLADVIGAEMPDLKETGDSLASANGSIGLVKTGEYLRGQGEGAGIWEDEDERRFYENLVDLKGKVPAILLEDVKKKKPDAEEQVGKRVDAVDAAEPPKPAADPVDDQSTAIANKTTGAQVDAILLRLPDLTTKEAIDQTAIDFCFLNSKASRNRLIKALTDVPKGRSDLLPCWARLVATLGQHMPDIPKGVVEYLDTEFRSLQRRKDKDFLSQVRLSNIRYLAELTKFNIVPEHVVFHCLKVGLDDFSKMNIEVVCNLLENCGRYLLRNPETSPRMSSFLETLQRKKSVQHIGQAERMLIENAIYYVNPPERPSIEQKERTPMELFVRKLVYVDLSKRNYSKVLKQIRRLHWEEAEVVSILMKVFSKPGRVKYGNIYLLAILLGAICKYHVDFAVTVIDNVIESIIFGLEQNEFKFNQRRIAEAKYLGELYNYRLFDHPVVFDTMYKILTFGHGGPPVPGRLNPFDLPDDFFRIRLIATILETCGMFFNRGAQGKKLDYFLSFFQYYIFTKDPLPMDIEFIVQDIYALTRPQWKLASNLEEASKAFQLAITQDQKTSGLDKAAEQDDASSGASSDEGEGDDLPIAVDDDEGDPEEDDLQNAERSDSESRSESEDEAIVVTRQEEELNPEDEAEFEREYAKMMAESIDSRKFDRKPLFDVPLPVRPKMREASEGPAVNAPGTMAFSLLTKRGNRQQTRTVELPSDSNFAIAMKNQQQAEREEQQRIKNLVLNLDLGENETDDGHYENKPSSYHHNRGERQGKDRNAQRSRKLQLSDVDWT